MIVEGRRTYAANSEILWSLLHDPDTLKRILPGCDVLEAGAGDELRLTIDTRIGPATEHLIGTLRFDRVAPHRSFEFTAESGNRSGALTARGRVSFEPESGERTVLVYEAGIEAGGGFAQVSPRLMQTTMNALARRALEALEREAALRTRVFTTTTMLPAPEREARSTTAVDRLAPYRRLLVIGPILLALALIIRGIDRRRMRAVARQVAEMLEQAHPESQPLSPDASSQRRV